MYEQRVGLKVTGRVRITQTILMHDFNVLVYFDEVILIPVCLMNEKVTGKLFLIFESIPGK